MPSRQFKDILYGQFARIGQALSTPKRIELLDLLSQGEKTVEQLAEHIDTPIKNTSAHLRTLRQANLVATRRSGTHVYYRLADDGVFDLLRTVQSIGRERLADVERATTQFLTRHDELAPVTLKELRRLMRDGDVTVLDVRPRDEYEAGHIEGALSVPLDELDRRLRTLPKTREVIAYCRGPYCVYAVDAVAKLRKRGFQARRADEGFPDWRAAGFPIATGAQ